MSMDDIAIRHLHDYADFLACEKLQRAAWKMTDDRDVVPAHLLSPLSENGGVVIGAFNPQGEIVGFVFGFVGRISDERAAWLGSPFIFCSDMMGVLPEYRSRSVGYRLKLAQRDFALAQGYRLITWTYDPLLSLNARLNITKLGCIARRYVEDAYGQLGGIYAGLSTDRFAVEWWIASQPVTSRLAGDQPPSFDDWVRQAIPVVNPATISENNLLKPGRIDLTASAPAILVQTPAYFQATKDADFELAQAWRSHTRDLFEAAFAQGYVLTGFAGRAGPGGLSSYYYLTRDLDVAALARE